MLLKLSTLFIAAFISANLYAASDVYAEATIGSDEDVVKSLVNLYEKEAVKENSKLHTYLEDLRKIQICEIEDTIAPEDVIFMEAYSTNGNYSMSYLIFIRCGYKSSAYNAGYLSASAFGMEAEIDTIQIEKPVQVTIK
jgi:hypothetical protein